jgi:hypothetical protein
MKDDFTDKIQENLKLLTNLKLLNNNELLENIREKNMIIQKINLISFLFFLNKRDECLTGINTLITSLRNTSVILEDDYFAFLYLTKAYLHSWKD